MLILLLLLLLLLLSSTIFPAALQVRWRNVVHQHISSPFCQIYSCHVQALGWRHGTRDGLALSKVSFTLNVIFWRWMIDQICHFNLFFMQLFFSPTGEFAYYHSEVEASSNPASPSMRISPLSSYTVCFPPFCLRASSWFEHQRYLRFARMDARAAVINSALCRCFCVIDNAWMPKTVSNVRLWRGKQGAEIVVTFACTSEQERTNWMTNIHLGSLASSSAIKTTTDAFISLASALPPPFIPTSGSGSSQRDDDLVSNASSAGSSASGQTVRSHNCHRYRHCLCNQRHKLMLPMARCA